MGFIFIYLAKEGNLPWTCYDTDDEDYDEDKVRMLKLQYTTEELCEGLPDCFLSYLKYVRGLGFDQ